MSNAAKKIETQSTATTYAKGPWSVAGIPLPDGTQKISDPQGFWIARVHFRNGDKAPDAEALANARLIAAAPELLASLKALLELWDGLSSKTANIARAVIAKAEGRS